MKIKRLNEDSFADAVKRDEQILDAEAVEVDDSSDKTEVESALDESLAVCEQQMKTEDDFYMAYGKYWDELSEEEQIELSNDPKFKKKFFKVPSGCNVLVVGTGGGGKTAIVKQWAEDNDINLVEKSAATMDETDFGGIYAQDLEHPGVAIKLTTSELDQLDEPRSVLFLDELNRASMEVSATLLTLVQDHQINTGQGVKRFPNFMFTIACTNPAELEGYGTRKMDQAELSRYVKVHTVLDTRKWLKWYLNPNKNNSAGQQLKENERLAELQAEGKLRDGGKKDYAKIAELWRRRMALAETLCNDPAFNFHDSPEDHKRVAKTSFSLLVPRTLQMALDRCDGTAEGFIKTYIKSEIDPNYLDDIKEALANYTVKDDKANDAMKYKGGSGLKHKSDIDSTVDDLFNDIYN